MKRVLVLASVASMIDQFNIPNIKLLQEMGYAVDVACNFNNGSTCSDEKIHELKKMLKHMDVRCYQIEFARDITNMSNNMKALWQVEHLMQINKYAFVHCHSPIGGVVGRIAGKLTKTKVIYTAHGFHFYKGAPKKNWIIYYPVEKICSHMTDVLITINKADYSLAQKKMKAKKVVYIPGVGIDLEKFNGQLEHSNVKRKEFGIPDNSIWMLAVGELISRKNHESLIRAVGQVENVYLTIAGKGELQQYLSNLICELGVTDRVKLIGFRTDVSELCKSCDFFAFPSFQEGLPVALMEAMASGKPVICSRVRGNTDLIDEGKGGFLFEPTSEIEIISSIERIKQVNLSDVGRYNQQKILSFSLTEVMIKCKEIYQKY